MRHPWLQIAPGPKPGNLKKLHTGRKPVNEVVFKWRALTRRLHQDPCGLLGRHSSAPSITGYTFVRRSWSIWIEHEANQGTVGDGQVIPDRNLLDQHHGFGWQVGRYRRSRPTRTKGSASLTTRPSWSMSTSCGRPRSFSLAFLTRTGRLPRFCPPFAFAHSWPPSWRMDSARSSAPLRLPPNPRQTRSVRASREPCVLWSDDRPDVDLGGS